MKTYKLVYLNPELHLTRKKDLIEAENILNEYAEAGWILQQIVSPSDLGGALIAVMYKD